MPATKLTKEQENKILTEYSNGKFANQLSKELGVYPQVITNCLRRNGIEVKKVWPGPVREQNYNWKGGIRFIKGYKHLLMLEHPDARRDGYIAEHRVIMEKKIGRRLGKEEVVHHMDGDIRNNHPDNLELHSSNGHHLSEHSKEWKRDNKGKWTHV